MCNGFTPLWVGIIIIKLTEFMLLEGGHLEGSHLEGGHLGVVTSYDSHCSLTHVYSFISPLLYTLSASQQRRWTSFKIRIWKGSKDIGISSKFNSPIKLDIESVVCGEFLMCGEDALTLLLNRMRLL